MKKIFVPFLMLSAMSCTFEVAVEEPAKLEKEITITATSGEPDTRTEREADGSVLWSPGDQISLFYGSGENGGSCFTAQNTETAKTVNFTGTIGVITGGNNVAVEDTYFWATYPYNATASCDGNSITTVLPSAQVATADTFADDLFPSMGRSQGLNMAFYNICGGLKFTVSEEGIKSVTLRSNAGEHIAGKITAGYDDNGLPVVTNIADGTDYVTLTAPAGETLEVGRAYYLVFVPTVFESGFTLTFSKGYSQAVMNRTAKTTIRRSVFGSMTNPDVGLEWEMLYVPIPDENFSAYMIQNFDTNGNGVLDFDEAETVTRINVNTDNITSMSGVEYCTNLQILYCLGTTSNWSSTEGKYFGTGKLASLDVSENAALQTLVCNYNQLTSLDVSANTALTELSCNGNQLASLDVSANTALTDLDCGFNQLTRLDVSSNTMLTSLSCGYNQLTSLDVSANTALTNLSCYYNQLTTLSVSGATTLKKLYCSSNQMTSLDISGAPALIYLGCDSNNLTSLNVVANTLLARLDCYNNQLTSLDLSNNSALTYLSCSNNVLTNLDLSANLDLTNLHCYKNQLTSLDLSANKSLLILSCYDNKLTSLDVSSAPFLSELDCSPMNDQSSNNMLATLYIADGQSIPKVTTDRNDSNVPTRTIVTSKPSSFMYSTPEAVDLGLSVKWASFNLGANTPEEYGHYYAWGETRPKARYNWENYQWSNGNYTSLTKYNTDSSYGDVDNKTILDLEDDVAHVYLGSGWRMPTQAETYELQTECIWEWTTLGGRNGYMVTGPNGNSIFMPAAGMRYAQLCYHDGSYACYWSSSIDLDYNSRFAHCLNIIDGSFSRVVNDDRCTGRSIRPVFDNSLEGTD